MDKTLELNKICQIYNIPSHYRAPIYQLIDNSFDSDYYFGFSKDGIKEMNLNLLKGTIYRVSYNYFLGCYYLGGIAFLDVRKYNSIIAVGEIRNISIWILAIRMFLFHKTKKLYFWSHGMYGKENVIKRMIIKLFYRLPRGGVFLYGYYARELLIQQGISKNKLHVIHNSLDYNKHLEIRSKLSDTDIYLKHFGNNRDTLIFIGRLTKVKRIDLLLKALALLKSKGLIYNLTIVGQGTEFDFLRNLVAELDIVSQVWFYGESYDEYINAQLLYSASLCVSPGNVGLTAIHALTFGCPVLTHNDFRWQMPEFEAIKPGVTGDLYIANNIQSLAERIQAWLNIDVPRENIRQACYNEIDLCWNPSYQLNIIKQTLNGE